LELEELGCLEVSRFALECVFVLCFVV
jgi:hypothetical protein